MYLGEIHYTKPWDSASHRLIPLNVPSEGIDLAQWWRSNEIQPCNNNPVHCTTFTSIYQPKNTCQHYFATWNARKRKHLFTFDFLLGLSTAFQVEIPICWISVDKCSSCRKGQIIFQRIRADFLWWVSIYFVI